ncbi:Fe2+-dependent dioxygenase [uncultured Cocleimonas sp.]|uniref:Fe2+-dependent dioxygenase n=1 Tax=uncultured Cocleimonas sp. TaxID=1051587 RepID=UPI002630B66D|nr:Fe2+-dependent dioxygenase [uncultured Cocleimonas sp.]
MLLPIAEVLTQEEVNQFRAHIDNAPWQDGKLSAGSQASFVKSNQQLDDSNEITQSLSNTLLHRLQTHPTFVSATLPFKFYPPKFNRYQNNGSYGLHVDSSIMTTPNQETIRTDISATLFLTDPDEYEGGELMIETQYGAQEVKLNAGDLIVYPSTSLHEVKPVTKGSRISAFLWVQSLVKNSQQREILFELDQSIQVLTMDRGADDTEVRRLSGVYHNSVRQWSEC